MSYEQAIIMGNLGSPPELKYMPDGSPVCNFSVAVNEKWTDKSTGEKREKTKWFRCAVWGKSAENAHKLIKKGQQVLIVGTVEARAYTGKNGEPMASLDLRVDTWQLLGSKPVRPDNVRDMPMQAPPPQADDIPF
jgi:single-strand DNA-binding protein